MYDIVDIHLSLAVVMSDVRDVVDTHQGMSIEAVTTQFKLLYILIRVSEGFLSTMWPVYLIYVFEDIVGVN